MPYQVLGGAQSTPAFGPQKVDGKISLSSFFSTEVYPSRASSSPVQILTLASRHELYSSVSMTAVTTITDAAAIQKYNRGPISTVFVPPTGCLSTLSMISSAAGTNLYFGHNSVPYFDPSCYPPTTTTNKAANSVYSATLWDLYYYSPAVSCPSGWYTAATQTGTFAGFGSEVLSLGSGTTAAVCCPSGYAVASFHHECLSLFPTGVTTILYKVPSLNNGDWIVPTTPSTKVYTVTKKGDLSVYGDGIPIWWQASDQTAFSLPKTTTTSPPAQTTIAVVYTTPTQDSTYPNQPVTSQSSRTSGLSAGTAAGIGIGTSVAILTLAAIAVLFAIKRKRRILVLPMDHSEEMEEPQESGHVGSSKSELPEAGDQETPPERPPAGHELYSPHGATIY